MKKYREEFKIVSLGLSLAALAFLLSFLSYSAWIASAMLEVSGMFTGMVLAYLVNRFGLVPLLYRLDSARFQLKVGATTGLIVVGSLFFAAIWKVPEMNVFLGGLAVGLLGFLGLFLLVDGAYGLWLLSVFKRPANQVKTK